MKHVIVLFISSFLCVPPVSAGVDHKNIKQIKLINNEGIERTVPSTHGQYIPGLDKAAFLNWIAVDSMANAFGPASSIVKPIVYDPATNILAVIHRGAPPYAAGSGQLWYNISQDGGRSWRRVGELNGGAPMTARYPTAAISNPANSSDTSQCLFAYASNTLETWVGGTCFTVGVDFPLGAGAGIGFLECVTGNLSGMVISAQPSSNWILVAAQSTNHMLWRTTDYTSVDSITPTPWIIGPPNFLVSLGPVGLKSTSMHTYYGVQGLFYPDSNARAFNAGYSKSSNGGSSWSPSWVRPQPDWMVATGLPSRYDLYDYVQPHGGTVLYLSDMVVDFNGRVHFFHVVVDSPWTNLAQRGILEVYETGTGWAYKWVTQNLNPRTALGYPGANGMLDQTGNAIHASITPDGRTMALVWLDAGTQSATDTLPDIWFSTRSIFQTEWSQPGNLTQTPGFAELMLHAAPIMEGTGMFFTLFLGRSYQCNINTYPPDNSAKTTFFVSSFTPVIESVADVVAPVDFSLEQNYPNPFNPTTTIKYTLSSQERGGVRSHVTLKVFDLMGREVATLVNQQKTPGSYDVTWDASKISSGVYFYRLVAGEYSQTRKLVLLR